MTRVDWNNYFIKIATVVSMRSPDTKKVGAVIVDKNNRILSTGYNGLPQCSDDNIDWNNREFVRKRVIHAETNAILHLRNGIGEILYCTLTPCPECIKLIKTAGIKKIYFKEIYRKFEETKELCDFFKIELVLLE